MLIFTTDAEWERFYSAGREYKQYNMLRKKSNYKRYVSFDAQNKKMSIVPEDAPGARESHSLGQLLLDFANIDLSRYAQEWQHTQQLLNDPDTEYWDVGCNTGHLGMGEMTQNDLRYNQLVCLDRLIKRFQHIHPYLLVFDSDYVTLSDHDPMQFLKSELNLMDIQTEVRKFVDLCLNDQVDAIYSQLLPTQRYFLHNQTTEQLAFFTNKSTLYVRNAKDTADTRYKFSRAEIEYAQKMAPGAFDKSELLDPVDAVSINRAANAELIVEEGYAVQTVRDMAMLELSRMIIANIRVRRCTFCGKLFMSVGKHNTRYCNRIPDGYKKSCQSIASSRNYATKMRKENADAVYRKVYKRLHQRKQKGAMTEAAFRNWQGYAQQQLGRCQSGEIGLEEFKEMIVRHHP